MPGPGLVTRALALSIGPAVGIGLARFGYAVLLPAMRTDLGWSYTQAGSMNTANSFGYLAGALVIAGVGGAVALITGATLAARLVTNEVEPVGGLVLGLYFGGVGMGIMSLAAFVPARRASLAVRALSSDRAGSGSSAIVRGAVAPSIVAYFLFGLGYITYMTFAVAFLGEQAWGPWGLSGFWLLLGASTFASGFLWPRIDPGLALGRSLALRLGVVAVGSALPLVSSSAFGVLVSAVLFGGAFLSVVSVVTEIIRRGLDQRAWSAAIALFTVVFSIGQTLGPVVSGAVADATGRLSSGFALSAGVLTLSVMIAAFQAEETAPGGGG